RRPVERRTERWIGRDELLNAFADLERRAAGELVAMLVEIVLERLAEAPLEQDLVESAPHGVDVRRRRRHRVSLEVCPPACRIRGVGIRLAVAKDRVEGR